MSGGAPSSGPDVLFVSMPFCAINRPALGVSILKAALVRRGWTCRVTYPCLGFADDIGLHWYREFLNGYGGTLLGEWLFVPACFREDAPADDYLLEATRFLGRQRGSRAFAHRARKALPAMRRLATALVERTATAIVATRPRIVGCTSTFEQHVASLAVLRRVRELDPTIVTCIGGSNCEAEMGTATARIAPWVDYVVSGEADDLIVELVDAALEHGRDIPRARLPYGVIARGSGIRVLGGAAPRAIVDDLDATPMPEFDDFFREHGGSGGDVRDETVLPVETARGCWWGEKSHCTFCGLLGQGMRFREKSQDRCVSEIEELVARHRVRRVSFVDNILSRKHFEGLLPAMQERGDLQAFFETKASLSRRELEHLRAAGVVCIQPGIESLHDDLSRTMRKGNATWRSIQTLKWARELGIYVIWNFLVGVPGADDEAYQETAARLPLLFHLQPPGSSLRVMFERFSPYHERPHEFGLELTPARAYASIYPSDDALRRDIAYLFEHVGAPLSVRSSGEHRALAQIALWQELHVGRDPPELVAHEADGAIVVRDTRPCAVLPTHTLEGLHRVVYRELQHGRSLADLLGQASVVASRATPAEVEACVDEQIELGLTLRLGQRLLALACAAPGRFADPRDVALMTGDCPPPATEAAE